MPKAPKLGRPSLGAQKRVRLSMTLRPELVRQIAERAAADGVSASRKLEELLEQGLRTKATPKPKWGARDQVLLLDMASAARETQSFVLGLSESDFLKDLKTKRAVERGFKIIGDTAQGLSAEVKQAFPRIPFRFIIDMRNVIAHDYNNVDHRKIWKSLKTTIPVLIKELEPKREQVARAFEKEMQKQDVSLRNLLEDLNKSRKRMRSNRPDR